MSVTVVGGAILAGGASRRFGSDKSLAPAGDKLMGALVAQALRDAGIDPVVMVGGSRQAAAALNLVLVPDMFPGEGPLGGTATALSYFTGTHVLVAPCDMPLLNSDTVRSLTGQATLDRAVVASVDGHPRIALGCWPRSMYRDVLAAVRAGRRRWDTLLDLVAVDLVEVAPTAIADADDGQTLADLLTDHDQ